MDLELLSKDLLYYGTSSVFVPWKKKSPRRQSIILVLSLEKIIKVIQGWGDDLTVRHWCVDHIGCRLHRGLCVDHIGWLSFECTMAFNSCWPKKYSSVQKFLLSFLHRILCSITYLQRFTPTNVAHHINMRLCDGWEWTQFFLRTFSIFFSANRNL
jgi:hypothetical protein